MKKKQKKNSHTVCNRALGVHHVEGDKTLLGFVDTDQVDSCSHLSHFVLN